MGYRMEELTPNVRVGRLSNGDLNVEIWQIPRGWKPGSDLGPMEEFLIPNEALEPLFEYLR